MEFVLLRKKANLKIRHVKMAGVLKITNEKIIFKPFFSNEINISLSSIKNVEIVKKFLKRVKIEANEKEYLFFTRDAKNVARLIKSLTEK